MNLKEEAQAATKEELRTGFEELPSHYARVAEAAQRERIWRGGLERARDVLEIVPSRRIPIYNGLRGTYTYCVECLTARLLRSM